MTIKIGDKVFYCPPHDDCTTCRGLKGTVVKVNDSIYSNKSQFAIVSWEDDDIDSIQHNPSLKVLKSECECQVCPYKLFRIVAGGCPSKVEEDGK